MALRYSRTGIQTKAQRCTGLELEFGLGLELEIELKLGLELELGRDMRRCDDRRKSLLPTML